MAEKILSHRPRPFHPIADIDGSVPISYDEFVELRHFWFALSGLKCLFEKIQDGPFLDLYSDCTARPSLVTF